MGECFRARWGRFSSPLEMKGVLQTVTKLGWILALGMLLSGCASGGARTEYGMASFHSPFFLSKHAKTASGERWWGFKKIAAHKSLPFGTIVRVTNLENGKDVKVRITDRGPYVQGRIIDVSKRAARALGMVDSGVVRVKVEVVDTP